MNNPWIAYHQPNPAARVRLFCFPHAGGSPGLFRTWGRELPATVEVCPVLLPGREARQRERHETDLDRLVGRLVEGLWPLLDRPFACFGHSLGAVLAFELARRLRRSGAVLVHLFVAARRAPQLPPLGPPLHALPDSLFVREIVQRYNGIPPAVLQEAELLRYFLPALRADFSLLESHSYRPDEPLDCAVSAFGGLCDPQVPRVGLEAWSEQARGRFTLKLFPGDHFFVQSARPNVLNTVAEELAAWVIH